MTNVLEVEERDPAEKEEALRLVRGVMGSPLWERMRKSRRRLAEVPFTVSELDAHGRETVTSGVIDLAFEEDEGWVIVDYKTDAVPDPQRLAELTEFYSQVRYTDSTGNSNRYPGYRSRSLFYLRMRG